MGVRPVDKRRITLFLSFAVLILWVSDTEIDRPQKSAGKPPPSHNYHLVAVKRDFKISLYDGKTLLKSYPIAIGKHPGDKMKVGDMRTPEGNFYIEEIQDSRNWSHDFEDGAGPIKGAYGPFFLRLYTVRKVLNWRGF